MDPIRWIEKRRISVDDKVAFRKSVDACRCMGLNYKGFQRGGADHPFEANTLVWFPKLYPNGVWDNRLDEKSAVITERCVDPARRKRHVERLLASPLKRRVVFARVRGSLGYVMYRFRGVFRLQEKATTERGGVVWKRISKTAKTYDYRIST